MKTREHLLIAEADNPNALLAEVRRPLFVIIILMLMACTVEFDTQTTFWTIEIKNEWPDTLLSAEFQSACATPLQCSPKGCFSRRQIIAQSFTLLFLFSGISFGCLVAHKTLLYNNDKRIRLLFDYRPHPQPLPLMGGERLHTQISN
jgi:hypothetical protein